MIGTYEVRVRNNRVVFDFTIKRNITVVRGNSGTGKTTLYEMIAAFTRLGMNSGVQITSQKQCVSLVDLDWQNQLDHLNDCIVFIDEGSEYISTYEFAQKIKNSTNYYVIFTRENLDQLPYSIDEIYEIKTSGK